MSESERIDKKKRTSEKNIESKIPMGMKEEEKSEYVNIITDSFKNKTSNLIYNSSKEHAKLLTKALFTVAEKEIRLFTGGSDLPFYDDDNLANSAKKITNFKIIIENSNGISEFKKLFPQAEYYRIKNESDFSLSMPSCIGDEKYHIIKHFLSVDQTSFRVELKHSSDAKSVEAVACANNEVIASSLSKVFDHLVEQFCEKVPI